MLELRQRLAVGRQAAEWSIGPAGVVLVVAQFLVGHPLHDVLHVTFVVVVVAFIVYEAFIKAAPLVGAVGVGMQVVAAWPRLGGYPALGGVIGAVIAAYLLITRPVPQTAATTNEAAQSPAAEPAPPAEALPRLGDPDFLYLPPPGASR
jgi:hypothetical protein